MTSGRSDTKRRFPRIPGSWWLWTFLLQAAYCGTTDPEGAVKESDLTPLTVLEDAFTNSKYDIQILQEGRITTILPDDTVGSNHQRFILELLNQQTLLVSHNIDLAPRVRSPVLGVTLRFYGEYEWNDRGGVIHWTHRDPNGIHIDGWLEYEGKRYQ